MPQLTLKPNHKAVRDYYATLQQYDKHNITHEGAVSSPFETLLTVCARQVDATLIPQFTMRTPSGNRIVLDGVLLDAYGLPFAYWEAKDIDDNLHKAVQAKREAGYPLDNIFFQNPQHGILYQNGEQVFDVDITDPTRLVTALQHFFAAPPAALANWHAAVAEFKGKVPALGRKAAELIAEQQETNPKFVTVKKLELSTYEDTHFRTALYRPFCQQYLYFHHFWNERRYQQHRILPIPKTEAENRMICVAGIGDRKGFGCLTTNKIPTFDLAFEKTQCFPFYTYNENGTNRQENITDWALTEFRTRYGDDTITKWDIFHYTYALLHHPVYREKYQVNLKRDLPHIPFAEDFWGFANAGEALADLHVNYESVPKYEKLQLKETLNTQRIDWQVEKMRFSKDKTQIYYNDYFTLDGIPAEAFAYTLGTRSALEWVVDQYRVKVDKRSGIVNDPNRKDDPQYIVDLIGRVITVSLRTVEIVKNLPVL